MLILRDTSIKRKLTIVTMLTSVVALLLASLAFLVYELVTFRHDMQRELSTLAQVLGENSAAALTFLDEESATQTLSALRVEPHIVGACIYTEGGQIFAIYERDGGTGDISQPFRPPAEPKPDSYQFENGHLNLFQKIIWNKEIVGTVYLQSDLGQMYSRLKEYIGIIIAVMILSTMIAFFLSSKLQRLISNPILQLADTARSISTKKDYSIRAAAHGHDEVGTLIEGFNSMLGQIQERDAKLQSAHNQLEQRVDERTRALQAEVMERARAEEMLEDLRHRYELILNTAVEGIYGVDAQGKTTFLNPAAARMLGYEINELIGKSQHEMIHYAKQNGDPYPHEECPIYAAFRDGTVRHADTEVFWKKDGTSFPVEYFSTPIYEVDGTIIGAVVTFRDITDRKAAEEQLRLSEIRFRSLVEQSPLSTQILTPSGFTVQVNHAWETLWGATLSDLGDYNMLDDTQLTEKGVMEYIRKAFAGEASAIPPIPYVPDRGLYEGQVLWTRAFIYPVKNHDGSIREVVLIHEDITEKVRAEEVIRDQAMLLDKAQDAIFVRGIDGIIQFWNKSAERLYGWTVEEAIGKNANDLLYKQTSPKLAEARKTVVEKGEWIGELHQMRKDGKEIIVESRWSLVRDNEGNPKSALIVNTDITQKKQLESQFLRAQRMESIGTLAGGIAHDINNVLAPILMSVDLFKRRLTDEYSQRMLLILETSAKRGGDLVKQVLAFARGVEGERTILQIKHIAREIEKIARETFPRSVHIDVAETKDPWNVSGDPTQLHQVLLNLCVNARDAIHGEGTITIAVENVELDNSYARIHIDAKPGPYVMVSVSDTGSGIPLEIIEKIFDPFFTTKERGKGTGLGLSTVIAIVKSHGGFLNVYSEVKKGTTFKVYLPALPSGEMQQGSDKLANVLRGRGELVLVVEDETSIQEITKETLENHGYTVLTANHGNEALPLFHQYKDKIDVVLTDMMMPFLDGPSTIRALRHMQPNVKVIAASGLAGNGRFPDAPAVGAEAFLLKPFTAEKLLKTLREVLDGNASKLVENRS